MSEVLQPQNNDSVGNNEVFIANSFSWKSFISIYETGDKFPYILYHERNHRINPADEGCSIYGIISYDPDQIERVPKVKPKLFWIETATSVVRLRCGYSYRPFLNLSQLRQALR